MLINVLLVENERLSSTDIESMLIELEKYNLLATFQDVELALIYIQENSSIIDILLLGIKLNGNLTGIDLAQKIINLKIPVLFLTEWEDERSYCKHIAPVEHFAYLAKPFYKCTLDSLIQLLLCQKILKRKIDYKLTNPTNKLPYIRIGTRQEIVDIDSINWIESNKNYCTIFTQNKQFTIKRSLKKIYDLLPLNEFVYIHKSHITGQNQLYQ